MGYLQVCIEAFQIDYGTPSSILFRNYKQRAVESSFAVYLLYCSLLNHVLYFLIQNLHLVG